VQLLGRGVGQGGYGPLRCVEPADRGVDEPGRAAVVGQLGPHAAHLGQGVVGVVPAQGDAFAQVGDHVAQGAAVDLQVPVVAECVPQ
jgi:hypothetical protein